MVFDFLGYVYIYILGFFFRRGIQKFQPPRHGVWRHHQPKLQSIVPILLNWSSHHGWWASSSKKIGVVESWGVSRFGGIPGGVDGKMWTCFHTKKKCGQRMCDENGHFHQQKKIWWRENTGDRKLIDLFRGDVFLLRDYSRVAHTQSIINRKFMSIDIIISVFITICIHIISMVILYTDNVYVGWFAPSQYQTRLFLAHLDKNGLGMSGMGLSCFDDTLLVPAWHKQEDFW